MRLTYQGIREPGWEEKGYQLPQCDLEKIRTATRKEPAWLHFGAGNLLRAFPAVAQQSLLDRGLADKGIIVCEAFDEEIIDRAFTPFDNLGIVVGLGADGSMHKRVVGSIVESIKASTGYPRLAEICQAPSLQMITMTITEKGYQVKNNEGAWLPYVEADLANFSAPSSLMGLLTKLCYERFAAGKLPVALVSLDNCSRNGDVLCNAVMAIAEAWVQAGKIPEEFLSYLEDAGKVSFTWSMIDKITPRPSQQVADILEADGLEDAGVIQTSRNSFVASFVNTEIPQYLAIEDHFPNGRPVLEQEGILFCDRETVDRIEKMKVRTALNPLHTVLAVYGCLLGYGSISAEMKNLQLEIFVQRLGYEELMPMVVNPGIIDPMAFIKEVIEERFPNPFIPDTPQRIACDTSQKVPVRFGETLAAYAQKDPEALKKLTFVPLFIAGWLRYLCGTGDDGRPMDCSPDPKLTWLQSVMEPVVAGNADPAEALRPILADKSIFCVDLYECGLADKVLALFAELNGGIGAVAETLKKYCI